MRAVLVALVLLAALPAYAQQPSNYSVALSSDQLNLVGKALAKLPYEEVYQTIDSIMGQVRAQQAAATAKAAVRADPPPSSMPEKGVQQ